MKKFLAMILALVMVLAMVSVASAEDAMRVAMITDYGDITDQSFNQTTYEACKAYCDANNIKFKYYKPTGDSTEARVASVNAAIAEGFTIIVMPGYAFGGTIVEVAENNPEIKFVTLDVARGDLLEAKYGKEYDYNPDNPKWTYQLPSNVTCFVYQEEISGFMAGYAAVKEGYKKLGFLGGMLASNYDVKTVFIDAFLKLIKIDLADAKWFFDSLEKYAQKHDVTFVLSVSADPEALPDFCKGYII